MDWTKIKPKHYLFTDMNLQESGALARIVCLTAYLERVPSYKEMVKATHYKTLTTLQDKLKDHSTSLQHIVNKVLEDVQGVEHKKSISRETTSRYRKKRKESDTSRDATEKRREEKRREENNNNAESLSNQIENLLGNFSNILRNKIETYLDRVSKQNKSKVITEGRKITLITELLTAQKKLKNDDIFSYAIDQAIIRDACNIGYVNAIIKNKLTKKPSEGRAYHAYV